MSILDTLLGTDNKLSEKDIAADMLKDSKFGVKSLSGAAAETVNPELRTMLRLQLDAAVKEHFELSDLAIKKQHQKFGIGKTLIELTQEAIGEQTMLLLLSNISAMEYYPKVGFEKVENGYIIKRKA